MAKKFWTFIGNDKYDIGLTGSTVYVYDKNGTELAKFRKDIFLSVFKVPFSAAKIFLMNKLAVDGKKSERNI